MVRYIIAVVLGCLYLAGSIWIVRSEGQAYRDSLSKTKLAAIENGTSALPLAREKAKAAPTPTAPGIESRRPEPVADQPAPAVDSSDEPEAEPAPPPKPVTEVAVAKPAKTAPSAERPPTQPSAAVAATAPANPLAQNPFWNQPQLTKVWDVSYLKPDDERRLGAELHDLIVQFNPLLANGPWLARVEDAAEPFLKTLRRNEIRYQFFILNSDAVNAFSHPGGYVYVSRGLFDLIGEDEDYALQFAIGHEIAHVDLQHAIRCLQDPDVKNMTQGTLPTLYGLILPFGYLASDKVDQEFQADEWTASRMSRFGRTRRETLNFLQKLDGYAKKHGFENGRVRPSGDASPLENHYRAQTAARKRLKHLKEFTAEASKTTK